MTEGLNDLERKVYENGHWHDHDPKGSPNLGTEVDFDVDEMLSELYTAMTNALNGFVRPYYGKRKPS